jgi:hypothetical protein
MDEEIERSLGATFAIHHDHAGMVLTGFLNPFLHSCGDLFRSIMQDCRNCKDLCVPAILVTDGDDLSG